MFEFEKYLVETPNQYLKYIIKYRTRNHRFPVETGCWKKIDLSLRKCNLCNSSIGDEYHYLFECAHFYNSRKRLIDTKYFTRPTIHRFYEIMNSNLKNIPKYRKVCKFIKEIV